MKNCRDYEDRISAFLDGELSGPEQAELMEHMAACQSCQQYFDDLVAIHEAAMELEEVPAPEGFAQQVMDRVRATKQDKAPKVIRFPQRRWAALAACCVFVLLGAWYFQRIRGTDLTASQEMVATHDMQPQMAADVLESTDGGGNGLMSVIDREQPADDVLSRMADSVSVSGMYGTEEEDAAEGEAVEYVREAAKDVPVPSPMAPAGNASGGTLIAGGEMVRQWVEDELGLDWESGQVYALTGEQYVGLVDFLTDAGAAFQVEAGDAFRLIAE